MDDPNYTPETKTFLSTEFFFYMLPCYVALASQSFRYYKIMQDEPTRNVAELPGQVMVTCFEELYHFDKDDMVVPPASYALKSKLCLMNCYTYAGMCLLGILGDPDLYYSAQHRTYSIIYFFGVAAWGLSALLLRRQFQRQVGQSLWTHRFFWIFSGVFSITKMFEDYLLPLNLIINVVFIVNNGILAMYALYRPEDRDEGYLQMSQMPQFAKIFFQKLELNETVRKLFKIQNQSFKMNLDEITTAGNNEQDITKDLEAFRAAMETSPNKITQGLNLLNRLPKRNIIVNKKIRTRKVNDVFKHYFLVITQISGSRFEAQRKFNEFVELDSSLALHFSQKNFPKVKLPRLRKAEFQNVPEAESYRMAQILESWLQDILANPLFLTEPVLLFLNVDEENSAPFLTYYNIAYTSQCSQVFLFNAFREKKQIEFRQQRVSVMGVVEENPDRKRSLAHEISLKMEFEVSPLEQSYSINLCSFQITCKIPKKHPIKWTIFRSEQQFRHLNEKLEEETETMVSVFYQQVSRIPEHMRKDSKMTEKKLKAYRNYLQKLLQTEQYYTYALFEFISFDPLKGEVVPESTPTGHV